MNLYEMTLPYGSVSDGALRCTESFQLEVEKNAGTCMVVTALAAYTGETAPEICFSLFVKGQEKALYQSPQYRLGNRGLFTRKQWRVPPMFLPGMKTVISVTIPEGTAVSLQNFTADWTDAVRDFTGGLRHNAHLGFLGIAPDNTVPALELAAQCGFPACIVVPKVTKDGVLVCIHDDTINRHARTADGQPIPEEMVVWEHDLEELQTFDYGIARNEIYRGLKMPLLSEFFDLCAKTGMRPMFSTHPGLSVEKWREVKKMLTERGILQNFHIKSFDIEVLKTAYSIFGTEIDGYTYDVHTCTPEHIETLRTSGIDARNCRVGIESIYSTYTKEIAQSIIAAGFFASAWNIPRITWADYERLISWGVREFTEDHHCSMGLNW